MVSGEEEIRIGPRLRIRSLPLAGLVLLGVTAAAFSAPAPPFVRFLVAFAAVVWIPGAVIVRCLLRVDLGSSALRHAADLFAGASFASLVTWPFVAAGAGFGAYSGVLLAAVAAVMVVGAVTTWRRGGDRLGLSPAVLVLVALGALAAVQGPALGPDRDGWDHIGYIRQIEATGRTVPPGVLAPRVDVRVDVPPDPRKGAFHDVLAVLASQTGVDPLVLWGYLPVVLAPFVFFAFVAFCAAFVSGAWRLGACIVLFAFSYGGVGWWYAASVAYGQNLAVAWYWVLVPLVLGAGNGRHRGRVTALAVILAAGGVFVHAGVALHALVLAATVFVFARALDAGEGTRLRAVVLGVVVLAAALWRVAWSHGVANAIHMHPQGLLAVGRGFVVSPFEVLRVHGMLFLGGLAMIPAAAIWALPRASARREVSFAVIPLVVCFVPFVTTPLVDAGTYLVSRVLLNVPVFPLVVTTTASIVAWSRARGLFARALGAAVLIAWVMVFVDPTIGAVARAASSPGREQPPIVPQALVDYVRHLPPESVILSDPRTAYALSAMTPHRVVAVNGQHGNPLDPDGLDRLEAVRDVLSPYVVAKRALDGCDRYGVDFVVVNAVSGANSQRVLSPWDSAEYPQTVARLESVAGSFRRVHGGDDFVVLLYDSAGTGATMWGAVRTPVEFGAPAGLVDCRVDAPGDAFDVMSVGVSPARAVPGETVTVTLGYETVRKVDFGLPYVLHVRFDHEDIGKGGDYPLAKQVRRMRERRGGYTLRLTRAHVPFEGRYGVDLWPIGRPFFESFGVDLPPSLRPGTYTVRLSIERASLVPNFDLRDLLFNNDRLSGTACTTLKVATQRVSSP